MKVGVRLTVRDRVRVGVGGAERTAFGGVAHLEHADGLARGLAARHGDVAQVDPHRAATPLLESVHRA